MTQTDDESQESRAFRQALERTMRKIGNVIKRHLPRNIGFAIFLFDFGPHGHVSYFSNSKRADMATAIRIWLTKVERDAAGVSKPD